MENSNFVLKPVPNTAAADWIRSKPVVTRRVFDKLTPELKCLAFTISGIESMDILEKARNIVAELPKGKSWDECKKNLMQEMEPYLGEKLSAKRAELLMRIHGLNAYRVGEWEIAQATKDSLPYFRYVATMDSRTRDTHRALNGLVLPVDDKFWDDHMPPSWEWGCRCQVVQISEEEKREQEARERKLPMERRRVLNETQKKELHRSGILTTGPTSIVKLNGSVKSLKNLRMPMKEILDRYGEETRNDLLAKLGGEFVGGVDGKFTVRDWLAGASTPTPINMLSYEEKLAAIDKIIQSGADLNSQGIIDKGREYFTLPMAKQGVLNIKYDGILTDSEKELFNAGRDEIQNFVKASLLEKSPTVIKPRRIDKPRSGYNPVGKFIQMDISRIKPIKEAVQDIINLKTFPHEFCHFLEDHFPELKKASVAFLKKRAGNEKTESLKSIYPYSSYRKEEKTFKDSWIEKGGDAYSGKYYTNPKLGEYFATEVLSMGIQRFLKNPILFYKQDREYFEFVVKQIQGA